MSLDRMEEILEEKSNELELEGFFLVSCKDNTNIEAPYNSLIEILKKTSNLYYFFHPLNILTYNF